MYLIIQLENGENIMKNILLIEKYYGDVAQLVEHHPEEVGCQWFKSTHYHNKYGDIAQMVDKSEWLKPIRSLVQVQLSPQTKKTVSSP